MRNVVQLCLTADNILLLAIALAWKWQFPEDIYKKSKLGDWMITVIEYNVICHCLADQLFASADLVLATDKSRYFAQLRPIFVHYFANFCRQGIKSWKSCPSLAILCNRLTEDVLIKIPEYNFLISKLDYFFGIHLIWSKVLTFKKVTNSVTMPVSNQISYETVLCVVTQCPFPTISWLHGDLSRHCGGTKVGKSNQIISRKKTVLI